MRYWLGAISLFLLFSCSEDVKKYQEGCEEPTLIGDSPVTSTSIVILGTIQDAGSPQIGCTKDCCKGLFDNPDNDRKVVSLGVIETESHKKYIFEATPDFTSQTKVLKGLCGFNTSEVPDGIFLTHAHIGHYTGLMYLGKEAMNANKVPVYAMPKMKSFLEQNRPWSQLVAMENIEIKEINTLSSTLLTKHLTVNTLQVPHRDEYSETVGYIINGPSKRALFIPDINKWEKWDKDIIEQISQVDYAFLDATFYDGYELNSRNMAEIPHPFIVESLEKFADLPATEKNKIHFIHFNHTNPVLDISSEAYKTVTQKGFNIAHINDVFPL